METRRKHDPREGPSEPATRHRSERAVSAAARSIGLAIVAGSLFIAASARAQQTEETWYGTEILVVDAASIATFALGMKLATSSEGSTGARIGMTVASVGGAVWFVGAPTVHYAWDKPTIALLSLGMRAGLGVTGAALAKRSTAYLWIVAGIATAVDLALAFGEEDVESQQLRIGYGVVF